MRRELGGRVVEPFEEPAESLPVSVLGGRAQAPALAVPFRLAQVLELGEQLRRRVESESDPDGKLERGHGSARSRVSIVFPSP